jgi:hypothetical protein
MQTYTHDTKSREAAAAAAFEALIADQHGTVLLKLLPRLATAKHLTHETN